MFHQNTHPKMPEDRSKLRNITDIWNIMTRLPFLQYSLNALLLDENCPFFPCNVDFTYNKPMKLSISFLSCACDTTFRNLFFALSINWCNLVGNFFSMWQFSSWNNPFTFFISATHIQCFLPKQFSPRTEQILLFDSMSCIHTITSITKNQFLYIYMYIQINEDEIKI